MFHIEVLTPPVSVPVAASDLRNRLRLNGTAEDGDLAEFVSAAVELFEADTNRPVLATTYRQYLSRWPRGPIVLGRGGVSAVASVSRYRADGTAEDLDGWTADLKTPPVRVRLAEPPGPVWTAAGLPVEPVGYVEFAAGWPNPEAVPALVRTAIQLLAGHYYEHREAYRAGSLTELPAGWSRVTTRYRLGLSGDWDQ